jgi:cell division septum initiation protein DivIVA
MHVNETRLVQRLRNPELPHSLRGFEETATRKLLEEAATAFATACEQRDEARGELHVAKDQTLGGAADAEAVGRALLAATATGEQIVASAQEQAAQLIDEVKAEADRVLAEARATGEQMDAARAELQREREAEHRRLKADRQEVIASARVEGERQVAERRAEADRLVEETRGEVARLRREAEDVGAFLESKRAAFAEAASAALERLERIEEGAAAELVADLHPGGAAT